MALQNFNKPEEPFSLVDLLVVITDVIEPLLDDPRPDVDDEELAQFAQPKDWVEVFAFSPRHPVLHALLGAHPLSRTRGC